MQVTLAERVPPGVLRLQASEVADVRWVPAAELEARYRRADPTLVPMPADSEVCCSAPGMLLWRQYCRAG